MGEIDDIGVFESKKGYWEIIKISNDNEKDLSLPYKLMFVPEEDNSENDIIININREHLSDLVEFIKGLQSKVG